MDETTILWGRNIRLYRESQGWSPKDLADKVGVSVATVSRWERGLIEPSRESKRRLVRVLQAPANVLFPLA